MGLGGLLGLLGERRGDEGGDHPAPPLAGMGRGVAGEARAAAPPGRVEDLADRGPDAFVGVGDDELDPAQAAPGRLAEERGPERLRLGGADVEARHLAPAIAVDADRDDHGTETTRPFRRTLTWVASIQR